MSCGVKIEIGDRLEINLNGQSNLNKTYVSQVEQVLDKDRLVVHMPIYYGELIKLPCIDKYIFLFFSDKGMIRYSGSILSYFKEENFNLMNLLLTSKGEKIQRREFFRHNCLLPIRFSKISEDGCEDISSLEMSEGVTKDIGGGGVRFIANEKLKKDERIKCLIVLGSKHLLVSGKVLEKQDFENSVYKYQYRLTFLEISPEEQEIIIQYIFTEQRRHLRK